MKPRPLHRATIFSMVFSVFFMMIRSLLSILILLAKGAKNKQNAPSQPAQGEQILSVVPPEFGRLPALSVHNGDFRRGICLPAAPRRPSRRASQGLAPAVPSLPSARKYFSSSKPYGRHCTMFSPSCQGGKFTELAVHVYTLRKTTCRHQEAPPFGRAPWCVLCVF